MTHVCRVSSTYVQCRVLKRPNVLKPVWRACCQSGAISTSARSFMRITMTENLLPGTCQPGTCQPGTCARGAGPVTLAVFCDYSRFAVCCDYLRSPTLRGTPRKLHQRAPSRASLAHRLECH